MDERNEVVTDSINIIDERRVITSQGSGTEIYQDGNLNERLIGLDNGCFCEKVGCWKDSGVETPMVRQLEFAREEAFTVRIGDEKYTGAAGRYGIGALAKWMLRIGQHRWRTTAKEQHTICGLVMARMGVG